ncbi:hypothetical protein LQW54_008873 [Pestalotiopsis sp. IQ-011]
MSGPKPSLPTTKTTAKATVPGKPPRKTANGRENSHNTGGSQDVHGSGTTEPPPQPTGEERKVHLWYLAFQRCYESGNEDKAKLLDELQGILESKSSKTPDSAGGTASGVSAGEQAEYTSEVVPAPPRDEEKYSAVLKREEEAQRDFRVLKEQLELGLPAKIAHLEGHKWKIPLMIVGDVDFDVVVEKFVDIVAKMKDFFMKNPIDAQRELLEAFHAIADIIYDFSDIESIPEIQEQETPLKEQALKYLTRRFFGRVWEDTIDPKRWSGLLEKIKEKQESCFGLITKDSRKAIVELSGSIQDVKKQLNDSFKKQLDKAKVLAWATTDGLDSKRVFWLSGAAGTGKSAIAGTIAERSRYQGNATISFYFSRNEVSQGNTCHLVPTLVRQLADSSRTLKHYICKALRSYHRHFSHPANDQWRLLVEEPLAQLETETEGVLAPPTVLIIIDGLDECSEDTIQHVFIILKTLNQITAVNVRAFITSRYTIAIMKGMEDLKPNLEKFNLEEDGSDDEITGDIQIYFEHRLREIKKGYLGTPFPKDEDELEALESWPEPKLLTTLVGKADRLFQYAVIMCNIVEGNGAKNPAERVPGVLNRLVSSSLDELYATALNLSKPQDEKSSPDEGALYCKNFRLIIGSILFSLQPLSTKAVVDLLYQEHGIKEQDVIALVFSLRSVLVVPELPGMAIKAVHLSLREFLADEKRCRQHKASDFHIAEDYIHRELFRSCKKVLCSWIPRSYSSDQIMMRVFLNENYEAQSIPSQVRYATLFWTVHSQRSKPSPDALAGVSRFAQEYSDAWVTLLFFAVGPEERRVSVIGFEELVDVSFRRLAREAQFDSVR